MNILISGGSGLIGTAFSFWVQHHINGTETNAINITWLTRDVRQHHPDFVDMLSYENLKTTEASFDVILNLAGAGIADKRWSDARKQELMQSRLVPTEAIIEYISRVDEKPKLMLSGSAIGWYGNRGATPLDESSNSDDYDNIHDSKDFAHELCDMWEMKAKEALAFDVPVILLRTGIVIHPNGGMLAKLLPSFKMGAGGQLADGEQIMSWISLDDWVRATWFILQKHLDSHYVASTELDAIYPNNGVTSANDNKKVYVEIYNLTAPNPVSNELFTKIIGSWLKRPTFMTMSKWLLERMFGEMASLLVNSQNVLPKQLLQSGFKFNHSVLKQALVEQHSITNLS